MAAINPYCWPVRPAIGRWVKALLTGDRSLQYDHMFFFSDSEERRKKYHTYLNELAQVIRVYREEQGMPCEPHLFVDPVLCVAAPMEKVRQNRQLLMPFVSSREGYIISPYMDWLSFFFNREWRKPMDGMVSLMIKMADAEQGSVNRGKVSKVLTDKDKSILQQGVDDCREILLRMGAQADDIILGTLNSGHPGGMLPLTAAEAETLHHAALPENLYVADASLLPESLGLPPILTIMALGKRIARIVTTK